MPRSSPVEVPAPASAIQQSEEPVIVPESVREDQNESAHTLPIEDQSLLGQPVSGGARKVFEQTYILDQTIYSTRSRTQQAHSILEAYAEDSGRPSGSRIVSDTAVGTRRRKGRLETDDDKDPAPSTLRRSNSARPPSRTEEARLYGWAGPITATANASRVANPSKHSKQSVDVSYYAIRNLNPSTTAAAPATNRYSSAEDTGVLAPAQLPPATIGPLLRRPSSIRMSSREPPPLSSEPQRPSQNMYPLIPPSPSFPGRFFHTPPPTQSPLKGDAPTASVEAKHKEPDSLPVPSLHEATSISSGSSNSSSLEAPAEGTRPLSVAQRRSQLLKITSTDSSSNPNAAARERKREAEAVLTKRGDEQIHGSRRAPMEIKSRRAHDSAGDVKRPVSAATLARRNRIASATGVPKIPAAPTAVASTSHPAVQVQPVITPVPAPSAAVPVRRKRSVSGRTKEPSTGPDITPAPEVRSIPEAHSSDDSDTGTTASTKKKRRVEALQRHSLSLEQERLAIDKPPGAEASSTEQSDSDSDVGGWSGLDELKTPLHVARRKLRPIAGARTPIPIPNSQPLAVSMPLVAPVAETNVSDENPGPLRVQAPEVPDEDEGLLPKEPRRRGFRSEDKVPPITATRAATRNVAAAAAAARRRAAGLGAGVAVGGVPMFDTTASRGRTASRTKEQGKG